MATDPYNYVPEQAKATAPGDESGKTIPVAKHSIPATEDPATAFARAASYERNGASYAPTATTGAGYPNAPESALTGRNLRILPSAVGSKPFWDARATSSNQ